MAAQWYYAKGDDKHGPISGDELKQRARDGQLQPTDLVWKSGMPDWKPASRVKGLFGHAPNAGHPTFQSAAPTEPPGDPTQAPDLGSAVKGLFAAVTAKAKVLGTKATGAAKEYQAKLEKRAALQTSTTGNATVDDSPPVVPDGESDSTEKPVSKRAMATAGGGCLAMLSLCLLGALIESFSGTADLEISQEKYLRPAPTVDLESALADSSVPFTLKREDEELRVWKVGKNNLLAVTGPTEKLTGVFLFCGYSSDSTDSMTSTILVIHAFGSTLSPNIGSGEKWSEGDELLKWTSSLFKSGKTEERFVNGKRVVFKDMFPLGFQLSILPKRGTVDPGGVFTEMMQDVSQPDSQSSADQAKKNLLETAKKIEGPFVAVVMDIVDAVEGGGHPLSVADSRMYESGPGKHRFSRETLEAYEAWRTAWLAESK